MWPPGEPRSHDSIQIVRLAAVEASVRLAAHSPVPVSKNEVRRKLAVVKFMTADSVDEPGWYDVRHGIARL